MKTTWIIIPLFFLSALSAFAGETVLQEGDKTGQQNATPAGHGSALRISVSSNLASWVASAPNLGAEVHFARHFSVAVDGSYGWWDLKSGKDGFRSWSAGGEVRYWLKGDGSFTGHHFGIGARYGKLDYTKHSIGRYGDALLAGLTYGYNVRLAKNLHVDAGIGIGYIHTDYTRYTYLPMEKGDYLRLGERTRNLPGLTDFHVSIIYRIPTKH
nr:DUF3575 domain-containing protein [uncultured Bacteroides sp.]